MVKVSKPEERVCQKLLWKDCPESVKNNHAGGTSQVLDLLTIKGITFEATVILKFEIEALI